MNYTKLGAILIDANEHIPLTSNLIFIIAASVILSIVGTIVIETLIAPKIGKYKREEEYAHTEQYRVINLEEEEAENYVIIAFPSMKILGIGDSKEGILISKIRSDLIQYFGNLYTQSSTKTYHVKTSCDNNNAFYLLSRDVVAIESNYDSIFYNILCFKVPYIAYNSCFGYRICNIY